MTTSGSAHETIVEAGAMPVFYRPPHGALSPEGLVTTRRLGMRTVLWTAWGRDWRAEATPRSVCDDVAAGRLDGGTVLLHDSDSASAAGSWRTTLAALPRLADLFARTTSPSARSASTSPHRSRPSPPDAVGRPRLWRRLARVGEASLTGAAGSSWDALVVGSVSVSDEPSNAASEFLRNATAFFTEREPSEEAVRAGLTDDFFFENRRRGVSFPDADAGLRRRSC